MNRRASLKLAFLLDSLPEYAAFVVFCRPMTPVSSSPERWPSGRCDGARDYTAAICDALSFLCNVFLTRVAPHLFTSSSHLVSFAPLIGSEYTPAGVPICRYRNENECQPSTCMRTVQVVSWLNELSVYVSSMRKMRVRLLFE